MNKYQFFDKHALLRKETFGGTLFLVESGRRTYIDTEEFTEVASHSLLSTELAAELSWPVVPVRTIVPKVLPKNNFSAPDTVFIEVTKKCNLSCIHCLNSSGKETPDQLKPLQLEAVVEDAAASGVQEIRFTGGEPMTLPEITSLVRKAASHGLRCSMGTNAVLINEKRARELVEAGLHAAVVSLDGLEKTHDRIRGRTSFRSAIEGLEHLRITGIEVRVNVVVMRSNLSDLPPLLSILSERHIPVFLRRFIPSGRASRSSEEAVTALEYKNLQLLLRSFLEKVRGTIKGHYLREESPVPRTQLPFLRKECKAGHRGLVVLPNGEVQICGFLGPLGETSIGKLPTETLSEIWTRLNNTDRVAALEKNLNLYNTTASGPKTNCLAVALAGIKLAGLTAQKRETWS